MKIAVLTNNFIPFNSGNGSSIFLWSLTNGLFHRDAEVHLVSYGIDFPKWQSILKSNSKQDMEKRLTDSGFIPHLYPIISQTFPNDFTGSYVGRALLPRPEYYYSGFRYSTWISNTLSKIEPDIIFPYMVDAVAGSNEYRNKNQNCCIALVTDLDHLVRKYRRKYMDDQSLIAKIFQFRNIVAERKFTNLSIQLLKSCDRVCCSAFHHSEWLRRKGVTNIKYFPVPVLDRVGESWFSKKQNSQRNLKIPRILMLGNVNGIATLSGLRYFQEELMEKLDELYKITDFELRIIGGGQLEPKTSLIFSKYPWIKRIGFVDDVDEELLSSSIVLVPTSIPLGFRTRIAEAFSYGACVVAHKNNSMGMPELRNGENILLSENPDEFMFNINKCLTDNNFRIMIGNNARSTYNEMYRGDIVVQKILDYSFENKVL
mgnify:CR=1 FL=1